VATVGEVISHPTSSIDSILVYGAENLTFELLKMLEIFNPHKFWGGRGRGQGPVWYGYNMH